jgi:hypothetical protein
LPTENDEDGVFCYDAQLARFVTRPEFEEFYSPCLNLCISVKDVQYTTPKNKQASEQFPVLEVNGKRFKCLQGITFFKFSAEDKFKPIQSCAFDFFNVQYARTKGNRDLKHHRKRQAQGLKGEALRWLEKEFKEPTESMLVCIISKQPAEYRQTVQDQWEEVAKQIEKLLPGLKRKAPKSRESVLVIAGVIPPTCKWNGGSFTLQSESLKKPPYDLPIAKNFSESDLKQRQCFIREKAGDIVAEDGGLKFRTGIASHPLPHCVLKHQKSKHAGERLRFHSVDTLRVTEWTVRDASSLEPWSFRNAHLMRLRTRCATRI